MRGNNFKKTLMGLVMLLFTLPVVAQHSDLYTDALGKNSDSQEFSSLKGHHQFDMVNDQHYLSKEGIELILTSGTLNTISFYRKSEAYGSFNGSLPHGLKFGMSQAEVRNNLGKPTVAYNSGYMEFEVQGITYACSFDKGVLNEVGISVK